MCLAQSARFGVSDVFTAIFEPFASLCACVPVSVWLPSLTDSPMYDSALLADKSEISDAFPGLLEPFPSPSTSRTHLRRL